MLCTGCWLKWDWKFKVVVVCSWSGSCLVISVLLLAKSLTDFSQKWADIEVFEITTSDTLLLKCFISSMRVLWLMLHCPTFCDELIVAMSCHFSAAAGKMFDRFHIEMRLYWGCLRSLHQMDSSWSVSFHPLCGSCEWCCTVQPAVCSCGWAKNFRPTLSIEVVSQYGNTQKGSPACSLHACAYLTMMPASYCCHHKADTSMICYNTKRIIIRTQTSKRR